MKTKTLSQLRDADFADSLKASLKRYRDRNERPTSTQIINDALAMAKWTKSQPLSPPPTP